MPRSTIARTAQLAALIIFTIFLITVAPACTAATITVPVDQPSISAAVAAAGEGDTIYVNSGTYAENVAVNKKLTLIGVDTGAGQPIVNGGGSSAISISADYVNISGFVLTGATNSNCAGIHVTADNAVIEDNNASGNNLGIFLEGYTNNRIANNIATDNINYGIALKSSSYNTLTGNTMYDNVDGIDLFDSRYNTLTGNTVYGNQVGIEFNRAEYNTVNGNTVYGNTARGIGLFDSDNNRMYLNRLFSNDNNMVTNSDEMMGLHTNYWNSTGVMQYSYNGATYADYLGNYWDNYPGADADLNGLGDTSFALMGTDVDYHPIMSGTALQASFTANTTAGTAPMTVQFNDTSDGNPTAWQWNFGDETANSTERNATHTYAATGTYTVTLTMFTEGGSNTVQKTGYISVLPQPPAADFTANTTGGNAPLCVRFTDTSDNTPTAWQWNFGDGTPNSTEQNPVHTYTAAGTYTVTLTASNDGGSSTTQQTGYITVTQPAQGSTQASRGPPGTISMDEMYAHATPTPVPSPTPTQTPSATVTPTPAPVQGQTPAVTNTATPMTEPTVTPMPLPASPTPESGFPWMLVIAALIICIIVGSVVYIVWIRQKR